VFGVPAAHLLPVARMADQQPIGTFPADRLYPTLSERAGPWRS
jgi:hypothetical protein